MVEADDLEKICDLGRGAYGIVEKMRHIPSGIIMAVKVSYDCFLLLELENGNIFDFLCRELLRQLTRKNKKDC